MMLTVKVRPNASRTKQKGKLADGTIKIDIAAPAEDGKANEELIRFLAKEFDVSRSDIKIVSGQTAKVKTITIARSIVR